ncbi:phage tail assembly protein [Zooshikella marina]|uniref:phage tail assembly protein n=1 Tax=Zooshikella ganghwensis TaxID=202772 RepID=UPI001BAEBA09|nr:phage tail assembly protein [Zooshikella ganghwensis]MBU2707542.1 phage tail assembly protein [Zooshikella ganghwensis]
MSIIKLAYPITVDGQLISEIHLRRPKVRDRIISENSAGTDADKEMNLIANLAEMPPKYLEELDLSDYISLQDTLSDFLS